MTTCNHKFSGTEQVHIKCIKCNYTAVDIKREFMTEDQRGLTPAEITVKELRTEMTARQNAHDALSIRLMEAEEKCLKLQASLAINSKMLVASSDLLIEKIIESERLTKELEDQKGIQ